MGINIKLGKNYKIKDDAKVKVISYDNGNQIEIKDSSRIRNNLKSCVKISKNKFLDKKTNTIKEYNINQFKTERGIKRSMDRLRRLLKNNFFGRRNEIFITLTCREAVKDIDLIVEYFKSFWKKLQKIYKTLAFAYVIEMQEERESYHIHGLIKDMENKSLSIENSKIEKLWGQGFTKTSNISRSKRLNNINEEKAINNMSKSDDTVDKSNQKTTTATSTGATGASTDTTKSKNNTYGIRPIISYMTKPRTKETIPRDKQAFHSSKCLKYPEEFKDEYEKVKERIKEHYYLSQETTILIENEETQQIMNKHKTESYIKKEKPE